MFNYCSVAACGHYRSVAYLVTVILGVLITIVANWRREGGPFKVSYTYVGAELSSGAIIAGVVLLIEFSYIVWCNDGTFDHYLRWANAYPGKAVAPLLILINWRFFRYCRNQYWRALESGLTVSRGLRNTLVGSLAFTLSLLAF